MRKLARDQKGATAIEYGLIAALISLAFILGATQMGTSLSAVFGTVKSEIDVAQCVAVGSSCKQ